MFDRAKNVCSSASSRYKEEKTLHDIFSMNGYKKEFIQKSSRKAHRTQTSEATSDSNQQSGTSQTHSNVGPPPGPNQQSKASRPRYVSMPYVKGVSEPISRFLRAHNIIIGHSSRNLRKSLVHVKDKQSKGKRKGVVYEVKCDCGEVYIGETGRPKDVRMGEHAKDIEYGRVLKSAPARHSQGCDKEMRTLEAETLAHESNWRKRTVREAIEIKEKDPFMNRDVGKFSLSPIWDFPLRTIV